MGFDRRCPWCESLFLRIERLGRCLILRIGGYRLFRCRHLVRRRIGRFQIGQVLVEIGLALGKSRSGILQIGRSRIGACLDDRANFKFLGIFVEDDFPLGNLCQHLTIGDLGNGIAGMNNRQPYHGGQIGDDQDDVLGDLCPGDRFHPAEERADQDPAQTDEYADAELKTGKAAGDQSHAVDLRNDIGKRTENCCEDADASDNVAAITLPKEVRNGELTEFAQVGGKQQRHQAVTAGPAGDKGKPVKSA